MQQKHKKSTVRPMPSSISYTEIIDTLDCTVYLE